MAESQIPDTDRLIAAALQVNGRAPWGLIARTLGLPERSVARRGQGLIDRGLVRVSTYVDHERALRAHPMPFRIRTENGAVWSVARALAHRRDASSVSVLEGSNDIAGMVMPRDDEAIRRLLFEEFSSLEHVESINVTTALKFFRFAWDWQPGILDEEARRALIDVAELPERSEIEAITPDEEALIHALERDGRMPVTRLARELGASTPTIRRRLESLFERGLLRTRTEVVPAVFGLGLEALVWLRVPLAQLEATGERLAAAPEVKFCAATTGASQLLINVLVVDEGDFYRFLTQLGGEGLDGVEVVESLRVVTPVLRGSLMLDEGPESV